ncbi:hypothetical protein II582_05485 [bacterium]|nr:hypothetical protein [bacterium]
MITKKRYLNIKICLEEKKEQQERNSGKRKGQKEEVINQQKDENFEKDLFEDLLNELVYLLEFDQGYII